MAEVRSSQTEDDQPLTRGERIKHLRLALAGPMGQFISQGRFGELVATEQKRPSKYDTSTAKRWEDGAEPELAAIEAMSRIAIRRGLLYVSRAWLAFGDEGLQEAIEAPKVPPIERPKREDAEAVDESLGDLPTATGAPRLPQFKQATASALLSGKRGRKR